MNKLIIVLLGSVFSLTAISANAADDCAKLKDDANLIYASKGFCFKDPEAKSKYGNENCFTSKPKFSDKEQQRLDQIEQRQKDLNCK